MKPARFRTLLLSISACQTPAEAGRRTAPAIGRNTFRSSPPGKPAHDATEFFAALRKTGFTTPALFRSPTRPGKSCSMRSC